MEQIGKVIRLSGETAVVGIKRAGACGENCGRCAAFCSDTALEVEADNPLRAKEGQMVRLETPDKLILLAAFKIYIVPIIIMIGVYFLFFFLTENKAVSTSACIGSFALIFLYLRYENQKAEKNGKYQAKISKIFEQGE